MFRFGADMMRTSLHRLAGSVVPGINTNSGPYLHVVHGLALDVGRGGDHLDAEGHALAHAPRFSPRPLLRHGVVQQVSERAEQPRRGRGWKGVCGWISVEGDMDGRGRRRVQKRG